MDSSAGKPNSSFIENRSIDFIPENERHAEYLLNSPYGSVPTYKSQPL